MSRIEEPSLVVEHPWARGAREICGSLSCDPDRGLSDEQAQRRLDQVGPNELREQPPKPAWRVMAEQFANTMIVVLLAAVAITIPLGEIRDAIVILAIVLLNAVIGFVQEYRAERAMDALRRMTTPNARVIREGALRSIGARDVVPGDLLVLEAGEVVSADGRILDSPNLRVNEAPLTGESVPVDKLTEQMDEDAGELLADRSNMVFRGSAVVFGRATVVVTATGMRTALGGVAELLQAHQAPKTPLQRRIGVLGRHLAAAALIVCAIVFLAGIVRGEDPSLMFLTSVSLAVAAIPEALPAVVTVALAFGAQRMADRRALIRKLPAVETLGSVTVICTDKTGTLTQGRMLVERVWVPGHDLTVTGYGYEPVGRFEEEGRASDSAPAPISALLTAAVLCNDASLQPPDAAGGTWDVVGDPTEGALLALGAKAGVEATATRRHAPRIEEVPFDPVRRRMTTGHRTDDRGIVVASKGAPDSVLDVVSRIADGNEIRPILPGDLALALRRADELAQDGYRVLAIAGDEGRIEAREPEADLVLYGLVGMADPLRTEVPDAVAECRAAGIHPVVITGDHPSTARAIARRAGVDGTRVVGGAQLEAMDGSTLDDEIEHIGVFARIEPEQKLRIVEAWKDRGAIVAMTGDGVNDAPALRRADIGVAMGIAGTEVAKEAADMVLGDDNFATIVRAVREGRRIYDNIRRFVKYMLTANSGEIWVIFLAPFLGLPLPLLPVQILWINLVTDGLPAVALGLEPPEEGVMRRPPRPPTESVLAGNIWRHVLAVGLLMGAIPLALGIWAESTGRPWQTIVFTSLALLQLGHAIAVRSETETLARRGLWTNPLLMVTVGLTALLQVGLLWWPWAADLLQVEPLAPADLAIVLAASTTVFWVVEGSKVWARRAR